MLSLIPLAQRVSVRITADDESREQRREFPLRHAAGGEISPPAVACTRHGASVVTVLLVLESAQTTDVALSAANASRIANAIRFMTSPSLLLAATL